MGPAEGVRLPEVLEPAVCRALLRHAHTGRLAHVADGRPHIVPLNYAVDGDDVVVRLGPGTALRAVAGGAPVAFQVDGVDELYHQGWSVVVHGRAAEVVDPTEVARLRLLPLRPWAGGVRDHVVRIRAEALTGRRIS
jgi:nitroimidazol reductase NimA-like FMN-containing flavoprotein (pyridoxamine 5'-phosphate oxidase superfamily)